MLNLNKREAIFKVFRHPHWSAKVSRNNIKHSSMWALTLWDKILSVLFLFASSSVIFWLPRESRSKYSHFLLSPHRLVPLIDLSLKTVAEEVCCCSWQFRELQKKIYLKVNENVWYVLRFSLSNFDCFISFLFLFLY